MLTSTTPLRVALLHVTPPTFVGGYESFAHKLAVQLGSFGIDADQVTVPSGLSRVAYLVTAGTASHVPTTSNPKTTWRQARSRLRSADCIYVKNDPLDLAVARVLAPDIPLVIGVHSSLDIPRVDLRTSLRRLARSQFLFRRLLLGKDRLYHCLYPPPASWGLPPGQVRVVPHGLDANTSAIRRSSEDQTFLFVGRLNRDKGADLLCGLARHLMIEPKTRLIVVGDGEYGTAIGRQQGLEYYRYSPQVRQLMREATWLLMPSRWEQQPLVLLESLEERLPFIIGPAAEIQQFSLGDDLVLRAATVDALHQCCLAAIRIGRVPEDYERIVNRVIALSDKWPTPQATVASLVEVLKEAAMMGAPR